jgi:multiple sugar transport system ATP-binding protein
MQSGVVQQIGTPADVYERPANRFVAGFLGSPAMNFIDGEVDLHGRFHAGPLALALQQTLEPCAATLGVRPEHVHIGAAGTLEGKVTLVEPMGNHQVVWIACGNHLLSSIVHGGGTFLPGQSLRFGFDAARVSLFDPVHGTRLASHGMQYATA